MPQGLKGFKKVGLEDGERASVLYHSIFDYPLSKEDLIRWKAGKKVSLKKVPEIVFYNGYYFLKGSLKGKKNLLLQRKQMEEIAGGKMSLAKKAANFLSLIPSIRMVAITGSLAMKNASEDSDIDLMVIAEKRLLWTTRALSWFLLKITGFKLRKPNLKEEKDMLCLNIWMDESDLVWRERNIFTAHEIAQVIPLINRNETYEKFLSQNAWIKEFWPNAVMRKGGNGKYSRPILISSLRSLFGFLFFILFFFFEPLACFLQKLYMKKKVTREVITPTRAVFHPKDWSGNVLSKMEMFQN